MSLSFPFSNRNPIFKIFICVWLCWVIIALLGLSLGSVSRGLLLLVLRGLLCSEKLLLLWSKGSVAMAHGLSCLVACGIVPDQGLNPCLLHWQVDSYPLHRQGSSRNSIKKKILVHLDHLPRFLLFLHSLKWNFVKSVLQLPLRSQGTFQK